MRSLHRKGLGLLALAGLVAAGCAAPTTTPSASSTSPGNQTVTVGLPHEGLLTTSLPYAVAEERGLFADQGITVQPVHTSGGGSTVQTVIGGNVDLAVETGPASVMSAYQNGAALKIVAATMTGLDVLFFSNASDPYRSIEDLSGEKVGFSSPGSSSNVAVDEINATLEEMGRPPAQGEAIGGPPDQLTAVQTGQIAAGFTAAPLFFDQVAAGDLRLVAEPADFTAYQDVAVRVAFTSAEFAEQNPEALRGFLTAWQQAWEWSFENKAEAIEIYQQAFDIEQDAGSIQDSFDYYTPQMVRLAPIQGLDQVVDDAVRFELIEQPLTEQQLSELVDTSFAPKEP